MIHIEKKSDCCGCSACVQKCPKQCISLVEDSEGFLYPEVVAAECVGCGLCEKVCPWTNRPEKLQPKEVLNVARELGISARQSTALLAPGMSKSRSSLCSAYSGLRVLS